MLVAFHRVHQADHQIRRAGNVAQLRMLAHKPGGNLAEIGLFHVGLRSDDGHKPADKLDIAVDVALQFCPDQPELFADLGASALVVEDAILILGEDPRCQSNRKRNAGRQHAWTSQELALMKSGQVQEHYDSREIGQPPGRILVSATISFRPSA